MSQLLLQQPQELSKKVFVNGAGQIVTKTPWLVRAAPWLGRLGGTLGLVLMSSPLAAGTITAQREGVERFQQEARNKEAFQNNLKRVEEEEKDPYVTLFRGVHADHPDLPNAKKGMAVPSGGDANEEQHNGGNFNSIYTSWTYAKGVAQYHANKKGEGGVILEKKFKRSELVDSPDYFNEMEVLIPGVVTGAKPKPAEPGGFPSAF